jgi:ABC-type nickel/cobalt efflux system permease component RcnA
MNVGNVRNDKPRLWKLLTHPTFEVIAAILLVLLAAWIIVDSEMLSHGPHAPVLFGK